MTETSKSSAHTQNETSPATLSSKPKAGQILHHDGIVYKTIREGNAYILEPQQDASGEQKIPGSQEEIKGGGPKTKADDSRRQTVFYNPIQQFNRDLSVLAIRAFAEDHIDADARKRAKLANLRGTKSLKRKRGADSVNGAHTKAASAGLDPSKEATEVSTPELTVNEADPDKMQVDQPIADTTAQEQPGPGVGIDSDAGSLNAKAPADKIKILDALSATGLRALRYASELPMEVNVTANDLFKKATDAIALNVEHNGSKDRIRTNTGDAMGHMYSFASHDDKKDNKRYHVIDLDPYGSAVPFLDSAIHAIQDNGMLCVTCTDTSIFNSMGYLEKAYSQYGGMPMKGHHAHEGGLRLILHAIATSAAKYGVAIEPLLSLSIDFYARVFVRVHRSPAEVKLLAGKQMVVYSCDSGCGAWQTQYLARNEVRPNKSGNGTFVKHKPAQAPTTSQHCSHCGWTTHLCGPMYGGPLHNPAFIEKILSYLPDLDKKIYGTTPRIQGMLQTAYEELLLDPDVGKSETDDVVDKRNRQSLAEMAKTDRLIPQVDAVQLDHHPFYFNPSALAGVLHSDAPSGAAMKGALRHMGFRATRTHCKGGMIKTDAPWTAIWHIMRKWVAEHPIKEGALTEKNAGYKILHLSPDALSDAEKALVEKDVKFDEELGRDKVEKKLIRYQMNPRADWGPMNRAKAR